MAELQAELRSPDAHPRKLIGSTALGLFKKQCVLIGSALHDRFFCGTARPILAKASRYLTPGTMTAKGIKERRNERPK